MMTAGKCVGLLDEALWTQNGRDPCQNIGVAAPMAYFPFGGSRDSFFGDLTVHGRDAFEFYTDKQVTITRWL